MRCGSEQSEELEHARMRSLALAHGAWELDGFSARLVPVPDESGAGSVSSHDGERLSVWCGALLSCQHFGWREAAREFEKRVADELARERAASTRWPEAGAVSSTCLRAAAALTHNAGDVNQALPPATPRRPPSTAPAPAAPSPAPGCSTARCSRPRATATTPCARRSACAPTRTSCSPSVRSSMPGASVWRWRPWGDAERALVVAALLDGCRKVPGQLGYYRALSAFERELPGGLARLAPQLAASQRRELKDSALRQRLALPRASFEHSYAKRARTLLDGRG
ncbi:MAG: hypothetical protein IPK67_18250 [Planctomycetes bacterium]|nr:hypothetical protein [Planctomycetota bacterium]